MSLPQADKAFLLERNLTYEVTLEAGMTCIVISQWPLPPGFDRNTADLLVRLSPGYPDVHPDMWWFDPPVHRFDGGSLPATEVVEWHCGRMWQRWSRHFSHGQWRPGIDGLESYLALIREDIETALPTSVR
jgi:hypothetical protein